MCVYDFYASSLLTICPLIGVQQAGPSSILFIIYKKNIQMRMWGPSSLLKAARNPIVAASPIGATIIA